MNVLFPKFKNSSAKKKKSEYTTHRGRNLNGQYPFEKMFNSGIAAED